MPRWIIEDTQHKAYLKFITGDFPTGLWSGYQSARKYESLEDAEKDFNKIVGNDYNWRKEQLASHDYIGWDKKWVATWLLRQYLWVDSLRIRQI